MESEQSTISVRKKIKTDLKSVGKTLSFAPCNDDFFFGNHPNVHVKYPEHFLEKKKYRYVGTGYVVMYLPSYLISYISYQNNIY